MDKVQNIDENSIKKALNRLRESQPDANQTKASLFNLIIYVHDPNRLAYFKQILDKISDQFPCRIIFIQRDDNQQNTLKAEVAVEVKGVSDQLSIKAGGEGLKRVPFLIYPHLIPDLPIYLFWSPDLTKDTAILPHIKQFATRIIIDSENTNDLQNFCRSILNQLQISSRDVVDMNWFRISGWKQILARAFDSKDRVDLLQQATYVRIAYNHQPDPSISQPKTQAIYLQAWLASCLGWKFVKIYCTGEKTVLQYEGSSPVEVCLEPKIRNEIPNEEILEFEISDPQHYECLFFRKNITEISVKASNQYKCLLPFIMLLPSLQSGKSFMQEVFYQRISEQYSKTLKMISLIPSQYEPEKKDA